MQAHKRRTNRPCKTSLFRRIHSPNQTNNRPQNVRNHPRLSFRRGINFRMAMRTDHVRGMRPHWHHSRHDFRPPLD